MKKAKLILFATSILLSAFILSIQIQGQEIDPGFPRQKVNKGNKLVYYPPQVDDWKNHRDLNFRMAFALTPAGKPETVGVAVIHANTDVDVDNRTVFLRNIAIKETHFPSLDQNSAAQMGQLVKTFLPAESYLTISLDRLVALVEKPSEVPIVPVRNDPPLIFVSNRPAMLIHIDGEPVFGKIKDTKLEFIINANFPVFTDKSKNNYYVFTGKRWLTAPNLQGTWVVAAQLPKDMSKLKADKQWAGLAGAIPPPASSEPVPTVFSATTPAEVILFQGQPIYTPIKGTNLVYASNTDSDLFVHTQTQTFYYLIAGRWFSAKSLNGPWTFATADLPPDFSRIPLTSRASRVLASVPGTEQAKDAVLLAQVPTTAVVDPKAAAALAKVTYLGEPDFKPIEGTTMYYAVNTTDRVIRVGDVYYLCLNGVWFNSAAPQGPWTTATSVPSVIYTIPPSSPVYNVTYVTQTTTSSGSVESSYTAGYLGTFVAGFAVGAIVACGTGYYYPPYYHYPIYGYPVYRPYPATYGVGAYYNSYTGAYGVARGVYGPYGGATGFASYNPYTGTYARGATAYGPYGSASVGRAYNPYTGTVGATRQVSTPYGQWGTSVISNGNQTVRTGYASTSQGTIAGARSTSGAAIVAGSGKYNNGVVARSASGDIYAGSNGNVYRRTDGGWQTYEDGSWNSVNKPQPTQKATPTTRNQTRATTTNTSRTQMQAEVNNLNRDVQNRQRGTTQTRNYQNSQRTWSRRSGGGGRRRQ